jgi:flavodoxin
MSNLRDVLLDVLPDEVVDSFLATVEGTNVEARTRIARAIESTTEVEETLEEETVEDEVEEVVEDVAEVEETTEVEDETVEVEAVEPTEIEFEVGEEFVTDITNGILENETFRTFVTDLISNVRGEFEDKIRSLEDRLQEKVEEVEDTPARNKRTVAKPFYRSRFNRNVEVDDEPTVNRKTASGYKNTADETINNVFGGK